MLLPESGEQEFSCYNVCHKVTKCYCVYFKLIWSKAMKNLVIFSVLAAFACSQVSAQDNKAEVMTLAFNDSYINKMVIPSSHKANKQASQQELESLNKAMEKLNTKLNNELEDKISKSLSYQLK